MFGKGLLHESYCDMEYQYKYFQFLIKKEGVSYDSKESHHKHFPSVKYGTLMLIILCLMNTVLKKEC